RQPPLVHRRAGRGRGPDRPQRRRQDHGLQPHHRGAVAGLGPGALRRTRHHAAAPAPDRAPRPRPYLPAPEPEPQPEPPRERRARRLLAHAVRALERPPGPGQGGGGARARRGPQAAPARGPGRRPVRPRRLAAAGQAPAARGRAGADGRPRAPAPRRARRRPQAAREGGPQGAGAPAARRGGHGAARRARHGRGHGPGRPHRRDEPRRAARQRDAGRGQARPGRDRGLPRTGGRMSADVETRVRAAAAADGPAPAGRLAAAGAEGAPTAQAAPAADGRPPLLAVERLSVRYGGVQALSEVDLSVGHGQLVTVIGANGAGKSSLVNAIVGVVPKAGGRVLLDGEDVTQATPEALVGRGVVLVPERRELFAALTVEDNLRLGAYRRYLRGDRDIRASLDEVYATFPQLANRRRQLAGTMSG